jgi:VWFA-related protein
MKHSKTVLVSTGIVMATLLGAAFAQDGPAYRTGVDLVDVGVVVTDKQGHFVTGLKAEDFRITEDGTPQVVQYLASGDATVAGPDLHVGLVLDMSGSMGESLTSMKAAAVKFVKAVEAADTTIVDFDAEVRLARYQPDQLLQLITRIRQTRAAGATALYDAVGVYLAAAADQAGRKVMILHTDGGDNESAMDFAELVDLLKASDVTVYVIGAVKPGPTDGWSRSLRTLTEIAEVTGGEALFAQTAEEVDAAYQTVLARARAQYTLGYVSTNDRGDGGWRKIKVTVAATDGHQYHVRGRTGYFAALRPARAPCSTDRRRPAGEKGPVC